MLIRKYPERRKNIDQAGPVKAVRLSLGAYADLQAIIAHSQAKWNAKEQPSISMILNKAIQHWAQSIRFDEKKLAMAHQEFIEDSTRSKAR